MPHPAYVTNGDGLTPERVAEIARSRRPVAIEVDRLGDMEVTHSILLRLASEGRKIYGVSTALGGKVGTQIDIEEASAFSLRTIRARAVSTGNPLPREVVRAAMFVRLNGLLHGGAGARPDLAVMLTDLLNADLCPLVPDTGSVGAADLCMMAHVGLAMIGEGAFLDVDGAARPAAEELSRHDLSPLVPGPRDGLAICSNSALSTGYAALATYDASVLLRAANLSASLSMEGFRANLSPLDARAAAARPQPGQMEMARAITALLRDSGLNKPGAARRLQDPVSFRGVSQLHGAFHSALVSARAALDPELNSAADNPLVLIDDEDILPNGNFLTPNLTLACENLCQAAMHMAAGIVGRCARLLAGRFTDLPEQLAPTDNAAGFAPVMKIAESLSARIAHAAQPIPVMPSLNADGVEDVSAQTYLAAEKLSKSMDSLRVLIAVEMLIAAQSIDLRSPDRVATRLTAAHREIRRISAFVDADRSLTPDIHAVADAISWHGGAILTAAYGT